jgi:ubiquinol-cytochrome c reductase iron-sulfur subunit
VTGPDAPSVTDPTLDFSRRQVLAAATAGVAAFGVGVAAIPFVASWLPSESARALGGPVEVDRSRIAPGQMQVVVWRRQPVYIVRRTASMLGLIGDHDGELKDPGSEQSQQPGYADNPTRSRNPVWLVVIGVCTHLGCLPKARFAPHEPQLGARWPGGFLCPCHGSRFDLAGRVYKGSPASRNLAIPPYALVGANRLVIGVNGASASVTDAAMGMS